MPQGLQIKYRRKIEEENTKISPIITIFFPDLFLFFISIKAIIPETIENGNKIKNVK